MIGQGQLLMIRGLFDERHNLESALRELQKSGVENYEAYGPVTLEEMAPLMPGKGSLVRASATFWAVIGLLTFFYMCVSTSLIYKLVVGGKLPWANIPFVVPAYEGTILLGAFGAFGGVVLWAALRPRPLSEAYDLKFSEDTFGVVVSARPSMRDYVFDLLRKAGASEVLEIREGI